MARVPTAIFVGTTAVTVGLISHYYRVRPITCNEPSNFTSLIIPRSTHRLYKRHLDTPIPSSQFQALPASLPKHLASEDTLPSTCLQNVVHALLTSRAYRFELWLTDIPLTQAQEYVPTLHSRLGNLTLVSLPSPNEAIFHYLEPKEGINYKMYVATPTERDILCGVVDYSGDWVQDLGARVWVAMVVEGTARAVERLSMMMH
ncbi:hypothetical protein BC832DRAFT_427769 [Gaertneriomyces semiglobifer]|nr:hypothetical protein BC832DRAFT_427769 [Gaertneriomyces semiglobifer]